MFFANYNFFVLELGIQPTLNNVLIPRVSQDTTGSPQDGVAASSAVSASSDADASGIP